MGVYDQVEAKLAGSETALNVVLIGLVAFGVFVILQKSRSLKLAIALWWIFP